MGNRPDIELALDIRHDERVVVVSNPESQYDYPDSWERPRTLTELEASVAEDCVVVVDRVEVTRRALIAIAGRRPRLMAFATVRGATGEEHEHEKQLRRLLTLTFPWSEVWTISTSFGKLLVTKDCVGRPYDRDTLVDMRTGALA